MSDLKPGDRCIAIYRDGHMRETTLLGWCGSGPIVETDSPYVRDQTYGPYAASVKPLEEPRNLDIGMIV